MAPTGEAPDRRFPSGFADAERPSLCAGPVWAGSPVAVAHREATSSLDHYAALTRDERRLGVYVDGKYVPERPHNVLVRSTTGARVLSALQLPFFTILPPSGFGVITTTGRRTGRARRKCIRVIRNDNKAYIVSIPGAQAAWVKNIRANPDVQLRIRGGRLRGIGRELSGPAERQQAMAMYCETVNPFDYAECSIHRRGLPRRSKIKELHRNWFEGGLPLVVELLA